MLAYPVKGEILRPRFGDEKIKKYTRHSLIADNLTILFLYINDNGNYFIIYIKNTVKY